MLISSSLAKLEIIGVAKFSSPPAIAAIAFPRVSFHSAISVVQKYGSDSVGISRLVTVGSGVFFLIAASVRAVAGRGDFGISDG